LTQKSGNEQRKDEASGSVTRRVSGPWKSLPLATESSLPQPLQAENQGCKKTLRDTWDGLFNEQDALPTTPPTVKT